MAIENLVNEVKNYRLRKNEKIKKEKKENEIEKRKEERFGDNERKFNEEKKKIYRDIIRIKDRISKIPQLKDLFDDFNDEIVLFNGYWGHKECGDDHGCWSRIKLDSSGELVYEAGYKWIPSHTIFALDEITIEKLTISYLGELHKTIKNGKFYDELAKTIKEKEPIYFDI